MTAPVEILRHQFSRLRTCTGEIVIENHQRYLSSAIADFSGLAADVVADGPDRALRKFMDDTDPGGVREKDELVRYSSRAPCVRCGWNPHHHGLLGRSGVVKFWHALIRHWLFSSGVG